MENLNPERPLVPALDTICFAHLRWNFVYQRPQHLMKRFGTQGRVFYIEEPVFGSDAAILEVREESGNIFVCVPHLPDDAAADDAVAELVGKLAADRDVTRYIAWFYTPMMIEWSRRLSPAVVVYDCMDELSNFKNPPAQLRERENKLFERADLVFTGGRSLYEAKKKQHRSVYAFPSSIDASHFGKALNIHEDMPDQAGIPRPRIGFVGVIDERADLALLDSVADLERDWNFIMVGPVVKIDESSLPNRDNIHYLGQKSYDELPGLLAGWNVAIMPFALNDSTRYISPTKTPEYLAAGLPVVSTAIADVVVPYGELGLVTIAATADEFASAIAGALSEDPGPRREKAARFLQDLSWDKTFHGMLEPILERVGQDRHSEANAVN